MPALRPGDPGHDHLVRMGQESFRFSQEHLRRFGLATYHPWRECPWCGRVTPYAHVLDGGPVPAADHGFTCHPNDPDIELATAWCLGSMRTLAQYPNDEYHHAVYRVSFSAVKSAARMGSSLTNNLSPERDLRPCPSGILRVCDRSGSDCRRYTCCK